MPPKKKKYTRPAKLRKPTKDELAKVEKASGIGLTDEEISLAVGISESSLKRHYRKALRTGRAKAHLSVASKIYEMAMAGNVPMIQLFAKHQMGWKDDPASLRAAAETPDGIKFEVELVKL